MKSCERCGACFEDAEQRCGFDGGALVELFPGPRIIGGRYLLEQRVASGAMGIVVRATHLQVGSTVAVKLMRPAQGDRHVALARFHREAQILGHIKHPNAVLVIDFGVETRAAEAVPYLVMEYLRGESLLQRLEAHTRLSLADTERVLGPLCEAVEEAHAAGVIHRDLKPSNVLLERLRDGSEIVKVLDFGIAKVIARGAAPRPAPAPVSIPDGAPLADADPTEGGAATLAAAAPAGEDDLDDDLDASLDELAELLADDTLDEDDVAKAEPCGPPTALARPARLPAGSAGASAAAASAARDGTSEVGLMIGTVPYMAPEQMTGAKVSRRTDVHAVAVIAFQCLAGRLPYQGDDEDIIAAKLSDERPSLRELGLDVPPALDALLQRCFALDPAERPGEVRAVAEALRAALAAHRPRAPSATPIDSAAAMAALARALGAVETAVRASLEARAGEDHYARARDLLLAMDAPLHALHSTTLAGSAPRTEEHLRAHTLLAARVDGVRRVLARVGDAGPGAEYAGYLRALWARLDVLAQQTLEAVASTGDDDEPSFPGDLFTPSLQPDAGGGLRALAERLHAKDALDCVDALEELLGGSLEAMVRALGPAADDDDAARALADTLTRGLWRQADTILLHELAPGRRGFRLLPFLAALKRPAAAPFATLARLLSTPPAPDVEVERALAALEREDRVVLGRCLLLHPSDAARRAAAAALEPQDLWGVIGHPSTPLTVERFLFVHLRGRARSEYLKVFFFCVRDNLLAATSTKELREALALVRSFFEISCFHEDIVFEPLLELERTLCARTTAAAAGPDDAHAYAEALAAFTAGGAVETRPIESMLDVPLPIQRKLAREGHFLSFFVSHNNERVAKETVPHLLRLEDVTTFLRIPTIHRVVLTELAKRKRFFRKDAAKLALLQNPKTPALVARGFVAFVSVEQLRLLAVNRHINPDVRRLISAVVG